MHFTCVQYQDISPCVPRGKNLKKSQKPLKISKLFSKIPKILENILFKILKKIPKIPKIPKILKKNIKNPKNLKKNLMRKSLSYLPLGVCNIKTISLVSNIKQAK